jgi:protein-S-isoprenylcysteine O-methyltransferase Ste14
MTQPLQTQSHPDGHGWIVRLGGWLFARRTWLPLPIAAALLVTPSAPPPFPMLAAGIATVVAGEWLRLWAVRHIGVVSRTRSDRLGPLIASGPFGLVRNPLYIANVLLWVGLALSAGLPWLAPVVGVLLGVEYHAIVRWEEELLARRIGDAYRDYVARVPRWIPYGRKSQVASRPSAEMFSWRETLFSERGTLIAIAVGYLLLWIKFTVNG